MEGTKTEDASGGTYRSTHYWAKLPKGRSHLPRRGPFFKWWKEQVFMCSRAWHSWFSVKFCLPPAPTPAVTSERVCLLLTQSECHSIERFADYLPMPMKSSHFFEVRVSVFQRIPHPETQSKQTKSRATPVELNSAEIFENLVSWPQWRERASKRLCNLPEVAQQIGAEAKIESPSSDS